MIPYKMQKIIIRNCAQTFPFAAKISAVTPRSAEINVNKSKSLVARFERMTTVRETSQRSHSYLVNVFNGLFNIEYAAFISRWSSRIIAISIA